MGIDRVCENGYRAIPAEFADTCGTYVVLAAEVLRKRRRYDLATDGGGGGEVRLARLAPGGRDVWT